MRSPVLASAAVLSLLLAAPAARAQSPAGWSVNVSTYAWLSGIDGNATVQSRLLGPVSGDVSASFSDILSDLNFAFMGAVEVRHGRFGLLTDFLYLDMSSDVNPPEDRSHLRGTVSNRALGLAVVALYRVVDDPRATLDIGAGIRPWWVESDVTLGAGIGPGRSASSTSNWVDPILAIRGHVRLPGNFGLSAAADIGGFSVGSEFTWQVLGTLDYRANDWLALRAGYRHLAFEFRDARTTLDLSISGPIIGATMRF